MSAPPLVTVIAIGNRFRGDDGAAAAVLTRLAEHFPDDARVRLIETDGESARMVQAWEGSGVVWLIDAVRSGRAPGTIVEIDLDFLGDVDDSGRRLGGGHLMGLSEAVELARALDRLPVELHVLGIEGERFEHGVGLSAAVEGAIDGAVEWVAERVAERVSPHL